MGRSYPFKNLDFSTRCWSFGYLWPHVRQRMFHSNVLKGLKNSNPAGAGSWFLGPLQKFSIRSFWEGGIITKYEWSFPLQIQRFSRAQSWGSWTDRINMGSLHPREDGAHVPWRGNSLKWGSRWKTGWRKKNSPPTAVDEKHSQLSISPEQTLTAEFSLLHKKIPFPEPSTEIFRRKIRNQRDFSAPWVSDLSLGVVCARWCCDSRAEQAQPAPMLDSAATAEWPALWRR